MKYFVQVICAYIYTKLFVALVFVLAVLPAVYFLSLTWWKMLIAILVLGGIITAVRGFAYTFLLMPFRWINRSNKWATGIGIFIIVVNFIRYGYKIWTLDIHGIWAILFCIFATYELVMFFLSALPILLMAYEDKE